MALPPGTRLGPYEVVAPIDSPLGEPDERYKATDTRANRIVSLKVLPPELATPEVKARLQSDSRTISSLNHPNIAALFEVGHQEPSTDFVVGEFIDGETLAERLKRGPLPLAEAMSLAIAIADSLDKAHRRGLIHGGLNPSSIVLSASGPKLIDFGVALVKDESSATLSSGSMIATRPLAPALAAAPALAMPYLSPEQAGGAPADARSDLFAFGAVLYEMLTGRPAFQEKTVALLMAAIQSVEPEAATTIQRAVPPALEHIVQRCLAKDPRQRLQTAWDLLTQLRWIAEGGSQIGVAAPAAAVRKTPERAFWGATAVVLLITGGLTPYAWAKLRPAPPAGPVRFYVDQLAAAVTPPLTISPDGRWIAVSPGAVAGLIAQRLDGVGAQMYIKDNIVTQPFWSPDNKTIAFFEGGQLKKAEIAGGPATNVCDVTPPIAGGTWSKDGVILFSASGLIYRAAAAGGQASAITELDKTTQETDHLAPSFLPDGRHYLFLAVGARSAVFLGTLDSRERVRLFDSESKAVYAAPGYVVFNRGTTVFAQPFDAKTLKLSGEPIRVADSVPLISTLGPNVNARNRSSGAWAVSQTGVLAFRTTPGAVGGPATGGTEEQRSLLSFDRSTGPRGAPMGPSGGYAGVDLSPDGKRLVVHRHDASGGDNWVLDIAQNRMQRLTFDASQDNSSPIWSPDGAKIAFASNRKSLWGIYVKPADGTGTEELIIESPAAKQPMSWSPDGKLIVYHEATQGGDLFAVPTSGDKKPITLVATVAAEQFPQVSPDGKWLAYESNETGRFEIYVKPFPDGPGKWQVSTDGGQWPRWRSDSKELYFVLAPSWRASEIKVSGASLQAGVPQELFGPPGTPNFGQPHPQYLHYAVSADGQTFFMSQPSVDMTTATGGALSDRIASTADGNTGSAVTTHVTVVLNWPQLLTRK